MIFNSKNTSLYILENGVGYKTYLITDRDCEKELRNYIKAAQDADERDEDTFILNGKKYYTQDALLFAEIDDYLIELGIGTIWFYEDEITILNVDEPLN